MITFESYTPDPAIDRAFKIRGESRRSEVEWLRSILEGRRSVLKTPPEELPWVVHELRRNTYREDSDRREYDALGLWLELTWMHRYGLEDNKSPWLAEQVIFGKGGHRRVEGPEFIFDHTRDYRRTPPGQRKSKNDLFVIVSQPYDHSDYHGPAVQLRSEGVIVERLDYPPWYNPGCLLFTYSNRPLTEPTP